MAAATASLRPAGPEPELELPTTRRIKPLALLLLVLRQNPLMAVGYVLVLLIVLTAILAPVLAPYDPEAADPLATLLPPSAQHLMGTDSNGMDIFSRMLYAPRIDLVVAVTGTLLSLAIGAPIGLIVGYFHGRRGARGGASELVMRAADVLQAFPVFVLALALVAAIGQGARNVVIAIAFVNVPLYIRLMRTQAIGLRQRRFVDAARVAGSSDWRIIRRHILPNAMAPALVQLSVNIGWAILITAGMSFLGAGVRVPTPEWGSMVSIGATNIVTGQWWPAVFPGIGIAVTVFAFALVGDSIELMLDPVRRRGIARDRT